MCPSWQRNLPLSTNSISLTISEIVIKRPRITNVISIFPFHSIWVYLVSSWVFGAVYSFMLNLFDISWYSLRWRYNERNGISNHLHQDYTSTVCSGADQRKNRSFASLASLRGIHRWPVNSPPKGPVTRKTFHLMTSSCSQLIAVMIIFIVYCCLLLWIQKGCNPA